MKPYVTSALLFVAIGLVLYAGAWFAAEGLLYRTGDTNPFYKIAMLPDPRCDWVILGASHAMPLDFADFNAGMERETGLRIVNLATPGNGVLYNRFVLETFLERHRAAGVLYVLDSFAFYSRTWNEERFGDAKLLRTTPFSASVARRLLAYSLHDGVDPRAVLDYVSGFSKLNNRERFRRDIWEGEAQFERVHRPSASADRKRIAYLYPDGAGDGPAFQRYLGQFADFVAYVQGQGLRLVVIKTPVPASFRQLLPGEAAFDAAVSRVLAERGVPFLDFSGVPTPPGAFFDTDHLNRTGLTDFFAHHLKPVLLQEAPAAAGAGAPATPAR
jgi:hypothetical protein